MPHVIVKLVAGRSRQQKDRIAAEVTKVIMAEADVDRDAVSVGIEDVEPGEWVEKVHRPDILGARHALQDARLRSTLGHARMPTANVRT